VVPDNCRPLIRVTGLQNVQILNTDTYQTIGHDSNDFPLTYDDEHSWDATCHADFLGWEQNEERAPEAPQNEEPAPETLSQVEAI